MRRGSQDLTVTDMLCDAGGSSIGVTAAGASVRVAMNHWPVAIDTHSLFRSW
jgi:DNA (cytosine-5)-methyltransferase 1